MTKLVQSQEVQNLLDQVGGLDQEGGNERLKPIVRDLVEAIATIIDKHSITETEFWNAVKFLGDAGPEFGLIAAGVGLEHYMDIYLDDRDRQKGAPGGATPRTIEGPLYVGGAPGGKAEVSMFDGSEEGELLTIHGVVRNIDGKPLPNASVDVWHADTRGFYSHYDPTGKLDEFQFRRQIQTADDGSYKIETTMPSGYAVPPGGATDVLMKALGRHGNRPAHVHFFVDAPGCEHLTTQINIADDPYVHDDFAFATRDELIPDVKRENGKAEIVFDFTLIPEAVGSGYQKSQRPRLSA